MSSIFNTRIIKQEHSLPFSNNLRQGLVHADALSDILNYIIGYKNNCESLLNRAIIMPTLSELDQIQNKKKLNPKYLPKVDKVNLGNTECDIQNISLKDTAENQCIEEVKNLLKEDNKYIKQEEKEKKELIRTNNSIIITDNKETKQVQYIPNVHYKKTKDAKDSMYAKVPVMYGNETHILDLAKNISHTDFRHSYEVLKNYIMHGVNLTYKSYDLENLKSSVEYETCSNFYGLCKSIRLAKNIKGPHSSQIINSIQAINLKLENLIIDLAIIQHNLYSFGNTTEKFYPNNSSLFNNSIYLYNLAVISRSIQMANIVQNNIKAEIKNMQSKFKYNEDRKFYNPSRWLSRFGISNIIGKFKTLQSLIIWFSNSFIIITGIVFSIMVLPIVLAILGIIYCIDKLYNINKLQNIKNKFEQGISKSMNLYKDCTYKLFID